MNLRTHAPWAGALLAVGLSACSTAARDFAGGDAGVGELGGGGGTAGAGSEVGSGGGGAGSPPGNAGAEPVGPDSGAPIGGTTAEGGAAGSAGEGTSGVGGGTDPGEGGAGSGGAGGEQGGEGGAAPDPAALMVVETTPTVDASGVERRALVEITFDAAIDEGTVDADSVIVSGPGGPVLGELSVDDEVVTFASHQGWHVLGEFDVTVTTGVMTEAGASLDEDFSFRFRARDGDWQTAAPIASGVAEYSVPTANLRGDLVFPFVTGAASNIAAVSYSAETQLFSAATPLETLSRAFASPKAALDEAGNAIVIWSGVINVDPTIIGWSRLGSGGWSAGRTEEGDYYVPSVGLARNGNALVTWSGSGATDSDSYYAVLDPEDIGWSVPALLGASSYPWGNLGIGDEIVSIFHDVTNDGFFSRTYADALGAPVAADMTTTAVNWVRFEPLADGAMVSWQRDEAALWWSRYDAGTGTWTSDELGAGTGGSQVCVNTRGARVGVYRSGTSALATHAAPGEEFGLPQDLGTEAGLDYAGCFIDEWGNGHAFWAGYGTERVFWGRYTPDGGWTDPVEVLSSFGLRGWYGDEHGNLSLIYVDGGVAYVRRFE